MGTARHHLPWWRAVSLALVAGGAGAVMTAFGCGEQLPLRDDTPNEDGLDGGSGEASVPDGPTSSCRFRAEPTAPWIMGVGGPGNQFLKSIATDDVGNVFVGGSFDGTVQFPGAPALQSAGGGDGLIVSLDAAGVWRWGFPFGDSADQYVTALQVRDTTLVAASTFLGTIGGLGGDASVTANPDGYFDALVMGMSTATGAIDRYIGLHGPGQQSVAQIALPDRRAAVIVGENAGSFAWPPGETSQTQSKGGFDGIVGQVLSGGGDWMHDWGGTDVEVDESAKHQRVVAVAVSNKSQEIVVAGFFNGSLVIDDAHFETKGGVDAFIHKLDARGKAVPGWPKHFGAPSDQHASQVALADEDDIIVAGTFQREIDLGGGLLTSNGGTDIFLARFDAGGALRWATSFGGDADDDVQALVVDPCGDILIGGGFNGTVDFGGGPLTSAGNVDGFVVKLRGDGTHLWSHRFGDDKLQVVRGVAVSPLTGEVFFGGENRGTIDLPIAGAPITSGGEADIFLAKIQP